MTPLGNDVWFVRYAPTSGFGLHPTISTARFDGVDWFENLVEDIRVNGLINPIVVQNQVMPCDDLCPNRVVHGSNRYRAIKRLGWKHAPVLLVGKAPQWMPKDAKKLQSLEEAQSYITDGTFVNDRKHGCHVKDSHYAQTMIYKRGQVAYFDDKDAQ